MESMLIDRMTMMIKVYEGIADRAKEEQKNYMVDAETEGYKRVDMKRHAEWASAVVKESMALFVISDLKKILTDTFKKHEKQMEEYYNFTQRR